MKVTIAAMNKWLIREGIESKQLAELLGVKKSTISKWRARGFIPAASVPKIEMLLSYRRENVLRQLGRHTPELY